MVRMMVRICEMQRHNVSDEGDTIIIIIIMGNVVGLLFLFLYMIWRMYVQCTYCNASQPTNNNNNNMDCDNSDSHEDFLINWFASWLLCSGVRPLPCACALWPVYAGNAKNGRCELCTFRHCTTAAINHLARKECRPVTGVY